MVCPLVRAVETATVAVASAGPASGDGWALTDAAIARPSKGDRSAEGASAVTV